MSRAQSYNLPFGLLLSLVFTVAACTVGDQVLSKKDHGRTIELRSGSTLEIILPGNPSTGYTWAIAKVDARVLALQGEIEYQSDIDLPGSDGAYSLHFEALNRGHTDLLLIYQRPFEVDREPVDKFELTVIVER